MSKGKKLTKIERLEEARKAFKWWDAEELPDGINWRSLEHAGVVFAPPYIKHNIPLLYDGQRIELTAEQEEVSVLPPSSIINTANMTKATFPGILI